MWSWFVITPFFISGKEQYDGFQQCKGYLYQVLVATQTVYWLQAVREDCLNHKPFSISARLFGHSSSDFSNFLLLHPTSSLTHRTIFHSICDGANADIIKSNLNNARGNVLY